MVQQVEKEFITQFSPGENFWMPKDPEIVIAESGDGPNVLQRINRNGQSRLLDCRSANDLVSGLSLNGQKVALNKLTIPKVGTNLGARQNDIQRLIQEGFLLSPENGVL